jgi:GNAT superfamily N-acetyltransferase
MRITFTNFRNPTWEDKINFELNAHMESIAGQHSNQLQGIYVFYDTQHIGGVLFQINKNILWIDSLFVDEAFRRQSIGKQLMAKVYEHAKQLEIQWLQLNTFYPESRDFFKACDFEEIANINNWKYGLTCYFMKKGL